jgi:hypothetical protein
MGGAPRQCAVRQETLLEWRWLFETHQHKEKLP